MGAQSVLLFVHIGGKDLYYDALRVKSSKNLRQFTFRSVVAGASMGSQSVLLFVHIGGKDLFYDALRVITLRAYRRKDLYYDALRVK